MDTFRELTPEEIKLTTIQFMGQHLMGEIKELDRNIISKSNTLQGLTLKPEQIIESVGAPAPVPVNAVNPGINIQPAAAQQIQVSINNTDTNRDIPSDPNQLEFDFNNCNYAKLIFDRLDSLDIKVDKLVELLKKKLI